MPLQAYKRHLSENGEDKSGLDATIQLLSHTSEVIEFFSTSREAVLRKDDVRIKNLDAFLTFLTEWREEFTATNAKEFISNKLRLDLQSMIHGFKAIVNIKLSKFPYSRIKQWIVNQDGTENQSARQDCVMGRTTTPHTSCRNLPKTQFDLDKDRSAPNE